MGGNISGSSIQFHWSTCLSPILSSSYHNCSVALHVVRDTDSNRILFLVENSLSYPLFYSRIIWELLFLTLLRTELGFWWGLHESIDCFRPDVHFYYIDPASPWERDWHFHLLRFSSISFFRDLMILSKRYFIYLVRVTPNYFMLLVTILKVSFH